MTASTEEFDALTDADREVIEAEFALHKKAVEAQVSEFADALSGDDQLLRARLRQIEEGHREA